MRLLVLICFLFLPLGNLVLNGQKVELVSNPSEKKVDVNIDGKFFTSYRWPDNVYKPILKSPVDFPLIPKRESVMTTSTRWASG
jgi:hypothetical protein